jgi:hypothetical protein
MISQEIITARLLRLIKIICFTNINYVHREIRRRYILENLLISKAVLQKAIIKNIQGNNFSEDDSLLLAVLSRRSRPTFQRYVLPASP